MIKKLPFFIIAFLLLMSPSFAASPYDMAIGIGSIPELGASSQAQIALHIDPDKLIQYKVGFTADPDATGNNWDSEFLEMKVPDSLEILQMIYDESLGVGVNKMDAYIYFKERGRQIFTLELSATQPLVVRGDGVGEPIDFTVTVKNREGTQPVGTGQVKTGKDASSWIYSSGALDGDGVADAFKLELRTDSLEGEHDGIFDSQLILKITAGS